MRFADPWILWLLLLLPPAALVTILFHGRRRRALRRFAGGERQIHGHAREVSTHRRVLKAILLFVAVVCAIVAAARPQGGSRLEPVSRRGIDVVVMLDTSLSMAAEDISPNRIELARHASGSLVRRLAGNRIALVTFAGRATLTCPLTLDQEAVLLFLEAVDLEAVPVPGTALAEALRRAGEALLPRGPAEGGERSKAVVLFTDGEDHEEGIQDEIERLGQAEIPVYAIGVGTVSGGPIPLRDAAGTVSGYKKDRDGRVVTTRLSEEVLEEVAISTGGRYYRLTPAELEIDEIVEAISGMEATEFGSVLRMRYEERFQVPLFLALAALLVEAFLSDRRRGDLAAPGGGAR